MTWTEESSQSVWICFKHVNPPSILGLARSVVRVWTLELLEKSLKTSKKQSNEIFFLFGAIFWKSKCFFIVFLKRAKVFQKWPISSVRIRKNIATLAKKRQEYNFDVKVCMTMIDRTQTHLKLNYSSKHHIDQENELQQLRISCHIA